MTDDTGTWCSIIDVVDHVLNKVYYIDFGPEYSPRYFHGRNVPRTMIESAHTVISRDINGEYVWYKHRYREDFHLSDAEKADILFQLLGSIPLNTN